MAFTPDEMQRLYRLAKLIDHTAAELGSLLSITVNDPELILKPREVRKLEKRMHEHIRLLRAAAIEAHDISVEEQRRGLK